jgi:DNA adenine methylase
MFMLGHCNDEKTYYWVRNEMPIKNTLDVAKRFFYLRKTCYRGMLRYDKNGGFNPVW